MTQQQFPSNVSLNSPLTKEAESLPLLRRDLLAYEQILRDDVARVLPFEAHSLYFPTADEVPAPVWIGEEQKLLLPLRRGGVLLGVLLLRRPAPESVVALLPHLPGVLDLCLDKLALYKNSRTDALTGLATRPVLLERLSREVACVRHAFSAGLGWDEESGVHEKDVTWQASLGLVVLRLTGLRDVSRVHGHALTEHLMKLLGDAIRATLPEEFLAARTGDSEFALCLPGATRQTAESLTLDLLRALNAVHEVSPLTGSSVRTVARAGYALFPQDWTGDASRQLGGHDDRGREAEEAEALFDKARLAALRLGEVGESGQTEHGGVLGYGVILSRGGVIDQILPLSRVRVTLGRDVGAREGQRFSVWSLDYPIQGRGGSPSDAGREPLYKGEIVLADVRGDSSQADVLLLGDPSWPLAPGDRLALLPEDYGAAGRATVAEAAFMAGEEEGAGAGVEPGSASQSGGKTEGKNEGRPDPLTGLYRHGDFLAKLAVARDKYPAFGLVLIRFDLPPLEARGSLTVEHGVEHDMAEAAACLRRLMAEKLGDTAGDWFAGRYSLNSILAFHPNLVAAMANEVYPAVSADLTRKLGFSAAIGVACLPWLSYRAGDALECCRKALEYALLLPDPYVGIFDSLAITISADKRYSQGDIFGAMEEYRLALLADENNTLAWNSLGVSLAGVGRHAEARRALEEAVRRGPDDPAAHYNLGTACVTLGDVEAAGEQFDTCLALAPGHVYARIRLGELAEARKDGEQARRHYEDALLADPASPQPHRCLARLELHEGRPDKARERLHQALLRDPQDSFSLHLLARLYLDGGEDAELAETLARRSVVLRPDRKAAWMELARALEAQGRHREAREARVKASEL